VLIFESRDSDDVLVYDGFVHLESGEPKVVDVLANTSDKLAVRWRVLYRYGGTVARLNYRLAYQKGLKKANIVMNVTKYANQETAHGICSVSKERF